MSVKFDRGSCVLVCAALALYVDFTSYHSSLNADAILVYLISLIKWTPFYWGQDRYGMLIAGLCTPFHDPLTNLLVQNGLHMFAAFACVFLLSRYLFETDIFARGLLALLLLLGLWSRSDLFEFLTPWQIYTTGLALGLLGLIVRARSLTAVLCLVLASWCNFATGFFLVGLIWVRYGLVWTREVRREFVLVILSVAAGFALKAPFRQNLDYGYKITSFADGFTGWAKILSHFALSDPWNAVLLGSLIFIFAWNLWHRTSARPAARAFIWAVAYLIPIGATEMAAYSGYPLRYFTPSLLLLVVSQAGALWTNRGPQRHLRAVTAALVGIVLVTRFGVPSWAAVTESLDQKFGALIEDPMHLECTHVVGDYYRVWPTVFYARLKYGREIWGVSKRSGETETLYALPRIGKARICAWKDNLTEAKTMMDLLHLEELNQTKAMIVFGVAGFPH